MFWEPTDDRPGWLVRCLAEFADREVNLTRIESRPRRQGLGHLHVLRRPRPVARTIRRSPQAIGALRSHADGVRVLGSFPSAP